VSANSEMLAALQAFATSIWSDCRLPAEVRKDHESAYYTMVVPAIANAKRPSVKLIPGRVALDAMDETFACLLEAGENWNGYACPWFTKGEADRIMQALTAAPSRVATKATYDEKHDTYTVLLEGDEWMFSGTEHNGIKIYPIGTRGWCWGEEPFEYDGAIDMLRGLLDEVDRCGVVVSAELEESVRQLVAAADFDDKRKHKNETWGEYAERVQRVADDFDRRLLNQIGADDYSQTIEANAAQKDPNICHSHDYCDANMVMAAAFKHVQGYGSRVDNDYDTQLWNDAWNQWKADRKKGGPSQ
jgi:hypothetical protein